MEYILILSFSTFFLHFQTFNSIICYRNCDSSLGKQNGKEDKTHELPLVIKEKDVEYQVCDKTSVNSFYQEHNNVKTSFQNLMFYNINCKDSNDKIF